MSKSLIRSFAPAAWLFAVLLSNHPAFAAVRNGLKKPAFSFLEGRRIQGSLRQLSRANSDAIVRFDRQKTPLLKGTARMHSHSSTTATRMFSASATPAQDKDSEILEKWTDAINAITSGVQLTPAQVKFVGDEVQKTPYSETREGKLNFPDYDHGPMRAEIREELEQRKDGEKTASDMATDFQRASILPSVLNMVGKTPLIQLDRLKKALQLPTGVELLGKAEMFSAGGSVKDRIAVRMIEDAEAKGQIRPGDILIEATSGNTGVGLCLAGALKGYQVIITLPAKMSGEKLNMMKALGATIYRTPNTFWRDTESHIALALRLQKVLGPTAHILDQYKNPGNPLAHFDATADEIAEQCGEKGLDYMVIAAGTGGTITGISKKLKQKFPKVKVIGVDPVGSILALPEELNQTEDADKPYEVEGIGYEFLPSTLDRENCADYWVKTRDPESLQMARTILRHEGLMIGGSSGAAMAGAQKAIQELNIKDGRVCVLFADSVRNYMSKFLDDAWMEERGFPTQVLGDSKYLYE